MEQIDIPQERRYCSKLGFSVLAIMLWSILWQFGLYWLDGKSGLSACQFGLYRNAAGFQRIDVTENAVLSLPDASHSKSYAGYGAAASLF